MTLTVEPTNSPLWWVDSSYAVHPDMIQVDLYDHWERQYIHVIMQAKIKH